MPNSLKCSFQGQKLNVFRGNPQISSPEQEGEKKGHALQILIFQKRMYTFLNSMLSGTKDDPFDTPCILILSSSFHSV